MSEIDPSLLPYRQCVGLCLFNARGEVLIAERRDRRGAWQMPQGGIQKGEDPKITALRELKEEIGTDRAEVIGQIDNILRYEFPDWLQRRNGVFRGKYRGQEQKWFALRFLADDKDIDLSGQNEPETPEFIAWRWTPLKDVPSLIVEFKRPVYEEVVKAFQPLAEFIARGGTPPVI